GALRVDGDSLIYPPCAARWLADEAVQHGATLHLGIDALRLEGRQVLLNDGTSLSCGSVVHATGAWARALMPELPVRPRKGHLVITDRYPGFVRHPIVELGYLKSAHGSERESVAFNVQPRKTGQLLHGSSPLFD